MFLTKKSLSRRTLLRAAGATLALPLLDSMTPAFGATTKAVPRLTFLYIPNGVNPNTFFPQAPMKQFALSPSLAALEPYKNQVCTFSNMAHHCADRQNDGAGDHSRSTGAYLTGTHAKRTQGADLQVGVSADQIAAQTLGKDNLLPSLQLSMEDRNIAPLCDEGYTCAYSNTLSWSTPSTPLPAESDPRLVFERLFGEEGNPKDRSARIKEDRSILDSVTGSMAKLQGTLGASDKRKVDEYFSSVREVELRLQRIEAKNNESPVATEGGVLRPLGVPEKFEDHIRLMFDLQVLAFRADITRVTTLMFGREMAIRSYPQIGIPDSHHSLSHHDFNPGKLAKLHKIDAYHIAQVGYFLGKLRDAKDGDANLLDNIMVMYGGGMANGNLHNHSPLPCFVAGGGAGTLKGGRHFDNKSDVPMSNLIRTLLDKAGVRTDGLGDSTGLITDL